MSVEKITKQPTGIVERIMAKLKLGDNGKLQNFFDKQIKNLKNEIKDYQKAIENEEYNSKNRIDSLKEAQEDAEVELQDAYDNVKPEDVETNAKQDQYAITYWQDIEDKEAVLEEIKMEIEEEEKNTKALIEAYQAQIKEREHRISKIS